MMRHFSLKILLWTLNCLVLISTLYNLQSPGRESQWGTVYISLTCGPVCGSVWITLRQERPIHYGWQHSLFLGLGLHVSRKSEPSMSLHASIPCLLWPWMWAPTCFKGLLLWLAHYGGLHLELWAETVSWNLFYVKWLLTGCFLKAIGNKARTRMFN